MASAVSDPQWVRAAEGTAQVPTDHDLLRDLFVDLTGATTNFLND